MHPEPELLAAFAEGTLHGPDLAAVSAHLGECRDCRVAVGETVEFLRGEKAEDDIRGAKSRWLAAAAAAAVAVTAGIVWTARTKSPIEELISAAPRDVRYIEPRLADFPPAPLTPTERGRQSDPRKLKLIGTAGHVLERTAGDSSTDAVRAAAAAHLLTGDAQRAIESLQRIAEERADAKVWNDLAAAWFTVYQADPERLKYALSAADEAVRLAPEMSEALFNRALVLSRLGLRDEAIDAWNRFLQHYPQGPIADEARVRLRELGGPLTDVPAAIERHFEQIAAGDAAPLAAILEADAGELRNFFETEGLARWGQAVLDANAASARTSLAAARLAAAALRRFNGDAVLTEVVTAIDTADDAQRSALARAHVAYRDGRRAYRPLRRADESERLLSIAAAGFSGRSPAELLARTYLGVAVFAQGRRDEAETLFRDVERRTPGHFPSLRAYLRWQLASCDMARGKWAKSTSGLRQAIDTYDQLRERMNAAFVRNITAHTLAAQGVHHTAWLERIAALQHLGRRTDHRLQHAISGIVYDCLTRKEWREALSFLAIEARLARTVRDVELETHLLVRRAQVAMRLGNEAEARESLAAAKRLVASVKDDSLRERLQVETTAATALTQSHGAGAIGLLTDVLAFHHTRGWRMLIPNIHLRRGRIHLESGDRAKAAADFEAGIAEIEQQRASVAASERRWAEFDATEELFDEAIALFAETDPARAFAYAERENGAEAPLELAGIPEGTLFVRYTALPDRLLILTAGGRGYGSERVAIRRQELLARVDRCIRALRGGNACDESLGDLLVPRANAETIVFLPDSYTSGIPFAALHVSGEPLIARQPVTTAPSMAAYLRAYRAVHSDRRSTALVIDSSSTAGMDPLPWARMEASAIETLYARVARLSDGEATLEALRDGARTAQVLHFGVHGMYEGPQAALVLAGGTQSLDVATISRLPLDDAEVVVLAACGTARGPVRSAGVVSVANAFLEVGVPSVVATLWPIDDRASAEFFPRLHRQLANGERASVALRMTQLECIRDESCRGSAVWAAVQNIGR